MRPIVVGLLALTAAPAAAQVQTTPSAVLMVVSDELVFAGRTMRTTGVVVGGNVVVSPVRNTEFHAQLSVGNLTGDTPNTDNESWTDIQIGGAVFAAPWLAVTLVGDARGISAPLARTRWLSIAAGAEARAPLFDNAAQAIFRASFLPAVTVSGQPRPNFAASAATGLRFVRSRITGAVFFSLERYSFPATLLGPHAQQVASLGIDLGVRFPR
jgi:hypothetical protein